MDECQNDADFKLPIDNGDQNLDLDLDGLST
jgi:hypothetical protein